METDQAPATVQGLEPTPPADLVDGVPDDLDRLCTELLGREPGARPSGREVLRRLGDDEKIVGRRAQHQEPLRGGLIGRRQHQDALADAFATMKEGRPAVVLVQGRSGVGKSTLLEWFLDDIRLRHDAVTLAGRCYERETVPFKALDNLMDGLSQHLLRLPEKAVDAILPGEVASLARMFPVLDRVPAVAHSPRRAISPDDPERRSGSRRSRHELLRRRGSPSARRAPGRRRGSSLGGQRKCLDACAAGSEPRPHDCHARARLPGLNSRRLKAAA